jgi:hypothetical protein
VDFEKEEGSVEGRDVVEAQISLNQDHAEQLMQAVLKEAFSCSATEPETDNTQVMVNA